MIGAVGSLAWVRGPVGLSAAALIWGIGTGTNWVMSHAAIQRHAPDVVIGRLAAFDELLVTGAMVASALVGAVVADATGTGVAALTGTGVAALTGTGVAALTGAGVAALTGAGLGAFGLAATAVIVRRLTSPTG
jgi:hypothetical protein